jgi:hypothetical protein
MSKTTVVEHGSNTLTEIGITAVNSHTKTTEENAQEEKQAITFPPLQILLSCQNVRC